MNIFLFLFTELLHTFIEKKKNRQPFKDKLQKAFKKKYGA